MHGILNKKNLKIKQSLHNLVKMLISYKDMISKITIVMKTCDSVHECR